jgi:hypothetical protein
MVFALSMGELMSHGAIETRNFIVAYLDILGSEELLRNWSDEVERTSGVGRDPDDLLKMQHEIAAALRPRNQLMGMLEGILAANRSSEYASRFDRIGKVVRASEPNSPPVPPMPQVKVWTFSDTAVLWVPAEDASQTGAFVGFLFLLLAVQTILIESWSRGLPLRGGISFGHGTDSFFPGQIYGPVLLRAYQIENQDAELPRVVIDSRLVQSVLNERGRCVEETMQVRLSRNVIDGCLSLVSVDDAYNGKKSHILDWLKPPADLGEALLQPADICRAIDNIEKLANSANVRDSTKLTQRYQHLLMYTAKHKSAWLHAAQTAFNLPSRF